MAGTELSDPDNALRELKDKVESLTMKARNVILNKNLPIGPQQLRGKFRALGFQTRINWRLSSTRSNGYSALPDSNPICECAKSKEINKKGGTARVSQIEAKKEIVGDKASRTIAVPRKKNTIGYVFMSLCKDENEVFDALRKTNGIGRCLADGTHAEKMHMDLQVEPVPSGDHEESFITNTFNLLFGSFAQHFWRANLGAAEALDRIHNVELYTQEIVQEFHGSAMSKAFHPIKSVRKLALDRTHGWYLGRPRQYPGLLSMKSLPASSIEDVIDTERASGDVNKMLLGSFVKEYDDEGEDSPMQDPETAPPKQTFLPSELSSVNNLPRPLARGSTNRSASPPQPAVF
ncbi:MAG: hypothetical protein Q9173_003355, partial [Seirophora scorigena]